MGKPQKILVTGAAGYIGSVSADLLLSKGFEVVAIDNLTTGHQEALDFLQKKYGQDKFRFYQADLRDDLSEIFKKEPRIEAVLHYAGCLSVDESMKNPHKYFNNNTFGTDNLLTSLLKNDINNIIFSSTCAVYGEAEYVPIDEKHPTKPTNPYGASKRMIEQILEWYSKQLGLNYVILRYFNVCGASDDGTIGDAKTPSVHLVQNALRGALGIELFSLTCGTVDTPDKTPIRDYVNVVDLNLAHLAAIDYLDKGGTSQIINLGTGTGNSVLEIVKKVEEITGTKIDMKKSEPRAGEYASAIADIKKAQAVLDWQPTHTIADSINSLITWYKSHPHGWKD